MLFTSYCIIPYNVRLSTSRPLNLILQLRKPDFSLAKLRYSLLNGGNYVGFKRGNYVGKDKLKTYNFLFLCSLTLNGLLSIDDLFVSIEFLDVFIGVTIVMIKHHYPK